MTESAEKNFPAYSHLPQVLKAVVDISGKKMGNAVFAQTLKVINKQADGEKVIQVPIDLYTKTEDGKQWLATHVDGLP